MKTSNAPVLIPPNAAEARIKAAAEAAAKAFAGKTKTVFFDKTAGPQSPESMLHAATRSLAALLLAIIKQPYQVLLPRC